MIHRKLNLICAAGHRHYSPTPELFVGRMCFYPLETQAAKKRCQSALKTLVKRAA